MSHRSTFMWVSAAALLLVSGRAGADQIDDRFRALASQINANCPMMTDSITRADGVSYLHVGSERELRYRNTLMGVTKLNAAKVRAALGTGEKRKQKVCSSPDTRTTTRFASMIWELRGTDGTWITDIKVTDADCRALGY